MGTEVIMKRALMLLATGIALACISDAVSAHGNVGIYLSGPVYVSPPPIYRTYPPVIYGAPPILYRPPPIIYRQVPRFYYGYPYGYRTWWTRPYWRGYGYGYGYGGYRGWHQHRYHR